MPLLISFICLCASVASFSSTIASILPAWFRRILPRPVGFSATKLSTDSLLLPASLTNSLNVVDFVRGTSP